MRNVLLVSYGSREAAMARALYNSTAERFSLYIADKQRNPLNAALAKRTFGHHEIIPDLDVEKIYRFAADIDDLQFVLVGPEGPIINGIADRIEDGLNVPVLAPRKKFAIEGSKAAQRELIAQVVPEANPDYNVFPAGTKDTNIFRHFVEGLENRVVIKPSSPQAGKGVVVHGDHFTTYEEAEKIFQEYVRAGDVVVEEKLDGEESSFMAFCDGRKIVPVPDTRDYKRAFQGDRGPNTGGMGSYMDVHKYLPFMTLKDRFKEEEIVQKLFNHMQGGYHEPGLKGMPFYVAFMRTRQGLKILEMNSRPADPESLNVMAAMKTDFGEACLQMTEGSLQKIEFEPRAAVTIYLVPPTYGDNEPGWNGDRSVDLTDLPVQMMMNGGNLQFYPGSMEVREDGKFYMLKSRTLAVVGLGETIEDARNVSVGGIRAVKGNLSWRIDVASKEHIQQSIDHMKRIREA